MFDIKERLCIYCTSHHRHEVVRFDYPKTMKTSYKRQYNRKSCDLAPAGRVNYVNINKISRNHFAANT